MVTNSLIFLVNTKGGKKKKKDPLVYEKESEKCKNWQVFDLKVSD